MLKKLKTDAIKSYQISEKDVVFRTINYLKNFSEKIKMWLNEYNLKTVDKLKIIRYSMIIGMICMYSIVRVVIRYIGIK